MLTTILYGLERYKSFQEAMEGLEDPSPNWYNDGYEFLAKSQAADGSWTGYCGQNATPLSPFSSCSAPRKMSIKAKLGEGMLLERPRLAVEPCRGPSSATVSSLPTRSTKKSMSCSRWSTIKTKARSTNWPAIRANSSSAKSTKKAPAGSNN